MLKTLILICAAAVPPQDCSRDTARDVIQGPPAENAVMCGMHGMAYLAGTALGRAKRADEYVKIVCRRDERAGG